MGLFYCTIIPRKQSLQLFPILLLFFFLAMYSAQGRSLSKLQEIVKEETKEEMVMVEGMIGSRPPRCERRCLSCGHCEAVQVPIALHSQNGTRQSSKSITSKDDDS
ncbi:EPIDERMAL PATTERNING FACTOR-like protein 2 [Typha angustifolia]|uniref:EPIDERMAL PATTERNING FACTOR-like protein 2 n=1 Tax=Typha angustifolia TaxID=59011 RepID=UPI003C304850